DGPIDERQISRAGVRKIDGAPAGPALDVAHDVAQVRAGEPAGESTAGGVLSAGGPRGIATLTQELLRRSLEALVLGGLQGGGGVSFASSLVRVAPF
ncbi:MAG TPA: hypothetical protein VGF45_07625, partial [Polyangia bacterium]